MNPDKVPPVGTVVPEDGVLVVGDEREPATSQRVLRDRGRGHLA
jgi:hypothetical protein